MIVCGIVVHLFILRRVAPASPWSVEQARQRSETFYPRQVYMDAMVMLGVFLLVGVLALTVEFPLADRADPADHTFTPVLEWYFLFFYQFLKYVSGPLEPLATWVLPGLFILGLLLWPFLDRNPERRPSSRPIVLVSGAIFLLIVLGLLGLSLWQLHKAPNVDPSVAHGKALFARHHCMSCHRLHGEGGKVGPDLSHVGDARPDREWHIRHFKDPKSVTPGSIMPKFSLSEKELNDLASYMLSLKGAGSPPLTNVQTTLVPPGGATVVEFKLEAPGNFLLGDHALSRLERGLLGVLHVQGPDQPDLFRQGGADTPEAR